MPESRCGIAAAYFVARTAAVTVICFACCLCFMVPAYEDQYRSPELKSRPAPHNHLEAIDMSSLAAVARMPPETMLIGHMQLSMHAGCGLLTAAFCSRVACPHAPAISIKCTGITTNMHVSRPSAEMSSCGSSSQLSRTTLGRLYSALRTFTQILAS